MFTGIIEELGKIGSVQRGANSAILKVYAKNILSDQKIGDSIAVNGVCLTVTSIGKDFFTADIMHETLRRSSLQNAVPGTEVNLERAMAANGRFGGHIVSGHVDGTGRIRAVTKDDNAIWYTIEIPPDLADGIVEKGSIAIDGISLTVAGTAADSFTVSTIPHTGMVTNLHNRKAGDSVNLETDILGKYIARLLGASSPRSIQNANTASQAAAGKLNGQDRQKRSSSHSGLTRSFLEECGF